MIRPLVTFLLTSYNQREFIVQGLRAAFAQTYEPLEIIVTDDHSTDGSVEYIEEEIDAYKRGGGRHSVVLIKHERNIGVLENTQSALKKAHGELFILAGGDDVSHADRVSTIVEQWINAEKKPTLVFSDVNCIGMSGKSLGLKHWRPTVRHPLGAAMAIAPCAVQEFQDAVYPLAFEDNVYARRAYAFGDVLYIQEKLVDYRIGSGVTSRGKLWQSRTRTSLAMEQSCRQGLRDIEYVKSRISVQHYEECKSLLKESCGFYGAEWEMLTGASFSSRYAAFRKYIMYPQKILSLRLKNLLTYYFPVLILPEVGRLLTLCRTLRRRGGRRRLLTNSLYRQELGRVAEVLRTNALKGRRILVTGASGLVGSAIIDLLLFLNEAKGLGISVYAVSRDVRLLEDRFGRRKDLVFIQYDDFMNGRGLRSVDNLVLAASPAFPNSYMNDSKAVMKVNTVDVEAVLLKAKECGVSSAVYISSSEVYGALPAQSGGYREETLGEIDLKSARSCYAIAKRKAEEICRQYAAAGFRVVIVRPGHVYGPTARREDPRVSSAWIHEAVDRRTIVMKSDGAQIRSYVHCLDCATAILHLFDAGESGSAYNVANRKSTISILEMAKILSWEFDVPLRIDKPAESERQSFNPMQNSSLNATRLEETGWHACIDAHEGFSEAVCIGKAIKWGGKR